MSAFAQPQPQYASPLYPVQHLALPLGTVKPRGWLRDQLRIQANGISGHLDEYWEDVGPNCGWLGGTGDDWERPPYYCDGLLPLGHLLDDAHLIAKANRYVNWCLNSQQANGQFGPSNPDWWSRMIMLKVLMAHYEATQDERVPSFMQRYFHYMNTLLPSQPLFAWAAARAADILPILHWLYTQAGDDTLLELMDRLYQQGMDWPSLQGRYEIESVLSLKQFRNNMGTHVVNNAQGIKTGAEWYVRTGDAWHRESPLRSLENMMQYHGQPNGMWSGDEHLHGTSPISGTELCSVVELMYSLEELQRILGDATYGDHLEWVAYNALPATFKPDMWAHQYDQQVNQVLATVARRNWTDNTDTSNIYGQTPHFGCCQANFHQGWPKLVKSMIYGSQDGGLTIGVWGPCEAQVELPAGNVRLVVDTDYPFNETISVRVHIEQPGQFPLYLRIPGWAANSTVTCESETFAGEPGTYLKLERAWHDGTQIDITFPMPVRLQTGHRGLVSVFRGPLLYALKLDEQWVEIGGESPHSDWEVYPESPWNYGLALTDTQSAEAIHIGDIRPPSAVPFAPESAPVELRAPAQRLREWIMQDNSAADIDGGPHLGSSPVETVTLIPYGSTNLRIGAFPLADMRGTEVT